MATSKLTTLVNNVDLFLARKDLSVEMVSDYWLQFNTDYQRLPKENQDWTLYNQATKNLQDTIDILQTVDDEDEDGDFEDVFVPPPPTPTSNDPSQRSWDAMLNGLSGLEYDVAYCFNAHYPDMFTYWRSPKSKKDSCWLTFMSQKHRWVQNADMRISKMLSEDFYELYGKFVGSMSELAKKLDDDNAKSATEINIKKATALMAKLKRTNFKANIITELANLCYDPNIIN